MSLEGKIKEIEEENTGFLKAAKRISAWGWTKALASNVAGAALSGGLFGYGAINILTTTASFLTANYLVNRKKGFTKNSIQTDLVLGGGYTPLIYLLLNYIDRYTGNPLKWMGAYAVLMYPFTVATNAMRYIIEKYSPLKFIKGIFRGEPIKDIKNIANDAVDESVKSGAKSALYLTLPVAASHYLLPSQWLVASLFPLRTMYRYIIGRQGNKTNPNTYQNKMLNPHMQAA